MIKLFYSLFFGWYLLLANTTFAHGDTNPQSNVDEEVLKAYFAQNKIQAAKTPSGLYYVIRQAGAGPNAKAGEEVTVNYTGRLLDGKVFDSNTDPKFGHAQPLIFALGTGQVIKGWDIGVQLLNPGSIATFYIPSALAYGAEGAENAIPPNAILIFDVELLDSDE